MCASSELDSPMAGVLFPSSDILADDFRVAPSSEVDADIRVLFIHGGGRSADRSMDAFPVYLRARFQHFAMRSVEKTHDFELVIREHTEEIRSFRPVIVVGHSQGGPTILEV